MNAHVGQTVGDLVRTIPGPLNMAVAALLAVLLAAGVRRSTRHAQRPAPARTSFTSDPWHPISPNPGGVPKPQPEGHPYP